MRETARQPERAPARHDALVVGGSFAGLSAALYLARARRRVAVIDAGAPRNRFAVASHGFLGHDGASPDAMLAAARAQVAAYPSVTLVAGEAVAAAAEDGGFAVALATGARLAGDRLVLAFGIADTLPDLPGLAERWGVSVLHCPYCHGFEFAGRRLGVLSCGPMSAHQALLIPEWGPTTLFLNGGAMPEDDVRAKLAARGVVIEPAPIRALVGPGRGLAAAVLADGREAALEALYVAPRARLNSPIAAELGCAVDESPFGPMVRTDATKRTTVPGVYAAGDIARAPHSVTWAAADGVTAGTALHRDLVFPDLAA